MARLPLVLLFLCLCLDRALGAPVEPRPLTASGEGFAEGTTADVQAEDSIGRLHERLKHPQVAQARRALSAGKVEDCIRHLQQAAMDQPSLPPALLMLAYMYLADGNWNEGRIALERAAAVHADHAEVYQAWGQVALAQGRLADAWVHLHHALRLEMPPSWSENQKRDFQVRCYGELAQVCEFRDDWPGAANALQLAAAASPPDAALLGRWAKALLWSGGAEAALEKFQQAHALDASLHPPELSIAALQTERGDFDDASRWYEAAVKKYPDDGRVHFEFAGSLLLAGRGEEAHARLDTATTVGTNLGELSDAVSFLYGLIARSRGQNDKAERHFKEVLRQSPGHAGALYHLPLVLVEQQEEAKRRQALQIAMIHAQKNPGMFQAQAALGWVQYRLGQAQSAEESLRKAAANPALDGETAYYLAQVLLANGKASEAEPVMRVLRTAVSSPQLFLLREEAREWLDSVAIALD